MSKETVTLYSPLRFARGGAAKWPARQAEPERGEGARAAAAARDSEPRKRLKGPAGRQPRPLPPKGWAGGKKTAGGGAIFAILPPASSALPPSCAPFPSPHGSACPVAPAGRSRVSKFAAFRRRLRVLALCGVLASPLRGASPLWPLRSLSACAPFSLRVLFVGVALRFRRLFGSSPLRGSAGYLRTVHSFIFGSFFVLLS